MKAQFLQASGIDNEQDFLSKYPTQEAFFKEFPNMQELTKGPGDNETDSEDEIDPNKKRGINLGGKPAYKPPFDPDQPFEEVKKKKVSASTAPKEKLALGIAANGSLDGKKSNVSVPVTKPDSENTGKNKIINTPKPAKKEYDFVDSLLDNLDTGIATVAKSIYDAPALVYDTAAILPNLLIKAFDGEGISSEKFAETFGLRNVPAEVLKEKIDRTNKSIQTYNDKNGGNAFEAVSSGNYLGAAKMIAGTTMQSLPLMVAAMVTGGSSNTLMVIAGSTASTKAAELKESNPEMGVVTRTMNAHVTGVIEGTMQYLLNGASGAVVRKIIADKGAEAGSRLISKSFRGVIEKTIEKNPVIAGFGEIIEESLVEGANQMNDMASGIRTEFDYKAIANAGLSATGMGLGNTVAIYGAKGFVNARDYKKAKTVNKEIAKLSTELSNENLLDSDRQLISTRIDRLVTANKKLIGDNLEKITALPTPVKQELVTINAILDDYKSKILDLQDNYDLSEDTRNALIDEIKQQGQELSTRKQKVIEGGYIYDDFDKLPQEAKNRLKDEAGRILLEEARKEGKTSASFDDAQLSKKAAELRNEELKAVFEIDNIENTTTQTSAPASGEAATPSVNALDNPPVVEQTNATAIEPIKSIKESVEDNGIYYYDGEKGTLSIDGQQVVFETKDKIIELGNIDDLSQNDIKDLGLEQESEINISLNDDMSIEVNGIKYLNNYSNPESAISQDKDGNYTVSLDTENGQKRNFRGQQADQIVYQYKLKNFEENATEQQIESASQLADEAIRVEEEIRESSPKRKAKSVRKSKQITLKTVKEPLTSKERQTTKEIEVLRAEEQAELKDAIPDAEQFITDGKIDKTKLENTKDKQKFEEIYDKYDKLITPLLEQQNDTTPSKDTPANGNVQLGTPIVEQDGKQQGNPAEKVPEAVVVGESKGVVKVAAVNKKTTTKRITSVKNAEYDVDIDVDGIVTEIRSVKDNRIIPKFVEKILHKSTPKERKIISKNANYSKIESNATGIINNNQAKVERDEKVIQALDAFIPVSEDDHALYYLATGGNISLESAKKETGVSAKEVRWVTGFKKDNTLPSVEVAVENIMANASIDLDPQTLRDALINLIKDGESVLNLQDEIVNILDNDNIIAKQQELEQFLGQLSEKDKAMYDALQAEDAYFEELTDQELYEYNQQKIEQYETGQRITAEQETANEKPDVNPAGNEGSKGGGKAEQEKGVKSNFKLNNQEVFYHASSSQRKGRLVVNNAPQFGTGVYLSTNKDLVVEEFGENVTEVSLNLENPVYTNTKEWYEVEIRAIELADADYGAKKGLELDIENDETYFYYDKDDSSEVDEIPSSFISDAAKELGYDAIIDKNSSQYENEIVVLDESKIQYAEDVETKKKKTPLNSPELIDINNQLKKATDALRVAKEALDRKAKALDKELIKDNENLFGERKSQDANKLFDERVDADARSKATETERQKVKEAQEAVKKLTESKAKIESGNANVTPEIEFNNEQGVAAKILNQDNVKGVLDFLDDLKMDLNDLKSTIPFTPQAWNTFIEALKISIKAGNSTIKAIEYGVKLLNEKNIGNTEINNIVSFFKDKYNNNKKVSIVLEKTKESNVSLKKENIRGRFLSESDAKNLQKEIESKYSNSSVDVFNNEVDDIRLNAFNYDNPLINKVVNGVELRIASGLIRKNKTGINEKTWLLYADGKVAGEFYSVKDIKNIVNFIENNLVKEFDNGSVSRILNQDNIKNTLKTLDSVKLDPNNLYSTIPFAPQVWNAFIEAVKLSVKAGNSIQKAIQEGINALRNQGLNQTEVDDVVTYFNEKLNKNATGHAEIFTDIENAISQGKTKEEILDAYTDSKEKRQAENIYNRIISKNISEEDAYDEVKAAFDKARTELENKKPTKELIRSAYRGFVKRFTDRQYLAKRLLDKAGFKNVKNLVINAHGASGKAKIQFQEAYDKIYKGLSRAERNDLDKIIQAKRFIAIDESRVLQGKDPVTHPNFIDKNKSEKFLSKLEKIIGTEKYTDLTKRAEVYFATYKNLLTQMKENGLITQEAFDAMEADYQPRVFLQYVTDFEGNIEASKRSNQVDTGGLSSDQIKSLSDGDANSLVLNSEYLLTNSLLARYKAMAINNVNKRFMTGDFQEAKKRFEKLDPRNLKGDDVRFYKYFKELNAKVIDNPIIGNELDSNPKQSKIYNELIRLSKIGTLSEKSQTKLQKLEELKNTLILKYDKTPDNFQKAYYFVDGQRNEFFMEKELHESWFDNMNHILSSGAKEFISYASGSALLKGIATGNNPAFPIVNTPRDFLFTVAFSDQYSKIVPKAMLQVGKDVVKAIAEIRKPQSDVLEKYMEYGGAMDFLSSQGKLKKSSAVGKAIDKSVSPNARDISKSVFDKLTLHKIAEYSEIMFRLGIFQRSIQNQLKGLGLNNVGQVTDKQQLDDIYNEAVSSARSILDFNQGGTVTKDLESIIPYINVAFQGGRVAATAFEKDPVGTSSRILQVATLASAVPIGISLALISGMKGDDDEDKSAYEIYLHALDGISPYQKMKYMNIVTPVKDEEGEYMVLKIAKAQELSPFMSLTDDIYNNFIRGLAGKEKKSAGAITRSVLSTFNDNVMPIDFSSPAGLVTRNPVVKATLTYATGYDFFRDQPLSNDIGKVPLPVEGITMKSTEEFYKKIGDNFGLSPVRSKAFVESLITSPSTNPFVGMLYGGADAAVSDKDIKIIGKDLFQTIYKSTGKRVVSYSSNFNRQLAGKVELQDEIDAINIKQYKEKIEFNKVAKQFVDKEISKEDLSSKISETEPMDRKRIVNKVKDKIRFKDIDATIIDIKYEQGAAVKALLIAHHYGDILDKSEDSKKVLRQMSQVKGILTPEVMIEYKKLKEGLKIKTPN